MALGRSLAEWRQIIRYYQAGVINTLFGYGLFTLFISVGMSLYPAQAASHVLGATFNWFTYSRYAFRSNNASKTRFILSYIFNYIIGLAILWLIKHAVESNYLAALITTVMASIINYVFLRDFVYRDKRGHP
jgi:putative flippase GtrA